MARELYNSIRGLDILQELLEDDTITEIMVNGPYAVYIERQGRLMKWPKTFASKEKLEDVVQQIVGACNRAVNERHPIADARLSDGSRVNAVISPAALDGPILTIRRFSKTPMTMSKLLRFGSLSEEAAEALKILTQAGYSMLISGGTGAGKTTFLNALSAYIPSEERVISIEDNAELCLQAENLVRLEAKTSVTEGSPVISLRDLIRTALRMRPDRLIVGEVRGEEACDLLQAINTGHQGSLSTIHANTAADALVRLETLVMMGMDIPLEAIRRQIASGIDVIVHVSRMTGGRRLVTEIVETAGYKSFSGRDRRDIGQIQLNYLYRYDDKEQKLERVGTLQDKSKLIRKGMEAKWHERKAEK